MNLYQSFEIQKNILEYSFENLIFIPDKALAIKYCSEISFPLKFSSTHGYLKPYTNVCLLGFHCGIDGEIIARLDMRL